MPKLTEAKIVGQWCYHTYLLDGVEYQQECSDEEYDSLAVSGTPKLPAGAVWVNSSRTDKFDTESGYLEDNFFALVGGKKMVKLEGEKFKPE